MTPPVGSITEGRADVVAERGLKGRDAGGGLGIVLGVAAADSLPNDCARQTAEERAEAAIDLHGLHAEEAVEFLTSFLHALEREHYYGLAFAFIGRASHSVRAPMLQQAATVYLDDQKYAWRFFSSGVIAIDPLTHA